MDKLLNITKLAVLLSDEVSFDLSKAHSEEVLTELVELISSRLNDGDKIKLNKLGTFEKKQRAGRNCINPRDNTTKMYVGPIAVVKFKSSYTLKNRIRSHTIV